MIIGQSADGGELYLDAHEHSHGPHGLLAGMTGSGKSECLLTYLLSLAVTFSCQDVSFLLIDFKGDNGQCSGKAAAYRWYHYESG